MTAARKITCKTESPKSAVLSSSRGWIFWPQGPSDAPGSLDPTEQIDRRLNLPFASTKSHKHFAAKFSLVWRCLSLPRSFLHCVSEVMRAYLQQLRQETGLRLCEKVFDPQSDKPSKVRVQCHHRGFNERLGAFFFFRNVWGEVRWWGEGSGVGNFGTSFSGCTRRGKSRLQVINKFNL